MAHLSENASPLNIEMISTNNALLLMKRVEAFNGVCFLRLPAGEQQHLHTVSPSMHDMITSISLSLRESSTLLVYGNVVDLVHVHEQISSILQYQLWIAIKVKQPTILDNYRALPLQHVGVLVYTKYKRSLQHTKTRVAYSYCPACDKTTKDYGGKKHTYHHYGTLLSDVWRDIEIEPDGDLEVLLLRFADLFGIDSYQTLLVCDLRPFIQHKTRIFTPPSHISTNDTTSLSSHLIHGDCLQELRRLPDNSVDFAFADPPYNLRKAYQGYADDLQISDYFLWCDEWISEIARVLKPRRTFALLNIPLWSIRHFLHLEKVLNYQNWIVWDALSFPVRMIMPAHYTILSFGKGYPRPLPGLLQITECKIEDHQPELDVLSPMAEGYCLRQTCVRKRGLLGIHDRSRLSDIWWDVHRLKHNSRRVDHPCQLPPMLMYRLISLFTKPNELVLDCFNGTGTTTLAAHQMGRRYIGIEQEQKYHEIAMSRHEEIERGLDPFRKVERQLNAKNSPVARIKKQTYAIHKKTLQLEVRRVAKLLQRLPTRDDMIEHGQYAIDYYDNYFVSWGEVCAAARTTGMEETRKKKPEDYPEPTFFQDKLLEK